MSSMQTRLEAGLELLSLVFRAGIRGDDRAALFGQALSSPLCQSRMLWEAVDAVHAILSLVPAKGAPQVEGTGLQRHVSLVWLGRVQIILGLLRLVWETTLRTMRFRA